MSAEAFIFNRFFLLLMSFRAIECGIMKLDKKLNDKKEKSKCPKDKGKVIPKNLN